MWGKVLEILGYAWEWLKIFFTAFIAVINWIIMFIGGWKTVIIIAIVAVIVIFIIRWWRNR